MAKNLKTLKEAFGAGAFDKSANDDMKKMPPAKKAPMKGPGPQPFPPFKKKK